MDHYRPKSLTKFKHLINDYNNLLYACNTCNCLKTDLWPSDDPLIDEIGWLDPCEHDLDNHYRYVEEEDFKLLYFTKVGQWMVTALALDHPARIEIRRDIAKTIKTLKNAKELLKKAMNDLIDKYRENPTEEMAIDIENYKQTLHEVEDKLENWYKPREINKINRPKGFLAHAKRFNSDHNSED